MGVRARKLEQQRGSRDERSVAYRRLSGTPRFMACYNVRMILNANGLKIEIRDATRADVPMLLAFIHKMAVFEKLTASATIDSLQNALFGEPPAARAFIVYAG